MTRDDGSRPFVHRSATAANGSLPITGAAALALVPPSGLREASAANYAIQVGGTQQMIFRFHARRAAGGEDGAMFRGVLVGWCRPWLERQTPPLVAAPKWPKGVVLFESTTTGIVLGTSTSVNLHPVTQETASSQTFYEADTITPSTADANLSGSGNGTNYQLLNADGSNRQASIIVDTRNFGLLYWYLDNFSVAFDEVIVAAERFG